MKNVIIGIDLGGTNLRIGAVTPDNEMKNPSVIKSFYIANAHNPVIKLCEIIEKYRVSKRNRRDRAISIGVPSSVSN